MTQAKTGDTVKVHYTGKLEDGTQFDTSVDSDPLEFTIGQGDLIQGFEQAVIGMSPGETKTAKIAADQAYGVYDDDMVMVVDRNEFPANINPEVGQRYQLRQQDSAVVVTVTDVSTAEVTLDGNHPLAGRDLIFDIQLVEIV